ncbi:sensor histidine kinase [Fonticella tunisiensis]|uniref:histidine kinase n=1 Tax=Fonticella tunisiensis TaxID=1096341 RepID=A0A4R7KC29_9CLOT|nr:ATP-binding protein [Fonticella tunisiensis]TDT52046.1 PAS domain S-box-containing protein [Fonticella tunisiensis]
MLKTLKNKITFVYMCLVLLIAVVGITATFKLYDITKSIDGLMVNNYKSINAVNNMLEIVQNQNVDILNYIYEDKEKAIDSFHKDTNSFYKWFSIEYNNITEVGEKEHNERINEYYVEYVKLFSNLQEIRNNEGIESAVKFYNEKILPLQNSIKDELKNLSLLNERAMLTSKDEAARDSQSSLKIVLIMSAGALIGGFLVSIYFINKFFKPIVLLTETMKSVREGNLDKQAPVMSKDEIGELAQEFNNMTRRLQEFEQSTLGKLLNEKNKSLAIVKSISDPLIVLDTSYRIVLLNKACEDVFNLVEDKVINRHLLEAIRDGNLFDHVSSMLASNEDEHKQKIMYFKSNNKEYYFNVIVTAVRDGNSNINGVVVLFQDVTNLKQLEKMKTDLISTISHEFKTPLTSILIGTSLVEDESLGELNEKQKEIINAIKEDGERLSSLVNNLIDLSKIESDKSIFKFEKCSIEDVILNSIKGFYAQAEDKNINLYYKVTENLPQVVADFEKITWVINNLISNALKATGEGGEISINAYARQNRIYVSVKDTGAGIPEEYRKKIFDKFTQLDDPHFERSGSGLGLAIAKEIIEAHQGEIWCESKLNAGSNFIFTLPLNKTEESLGGNI